MKEKFKSNKVSKESMLRKRQNTRLFVQRNLIPQKRYCHRRRATFCLQGLRESHVVFQGRL